MKIQAKKLAVVLTTSLLVSGSPSLPGRAQPPEAAAAKTYGWVENPANGHYYRLLPKATWKTSADWAKRLGGHLVTIENQQEQDWVFKTFAGNEKERLLWIGLTKESNSGQFIWVDGTPLGYSKWHVGEPNGIAGAEFFVAMYYAGATVPGSWNDWDNRDADPIGIPMQGVVEVEP